MGKAHHTPGDNSTQSQQLRLLKHLREQNLSTSQIRRELDIMHPGARVQELREQGHLILTHWTQEQTSSGTLRRLARYVLVRESIHEQ